MVGCSTGILGHPGLLSLVVIERGYGTSYLLVINSNLGSI